MPSPFFTPSPATDSEEPAMPIDYILAGGVTVGLLVDLVYALVRPERF